MLLVAMLLAILLLNRHTAAQEEVEPVRLAWRFAEGDRLGLRFVQTTESTTSVNRHTLRAQMETEAALTWAVEAVDGDGVASIQQELVRLRMVVTTSDGGVPVEFDSAATTRPRGAARELAAALRPLVGAQSQFRMNARGEILAAQLSDATKQALGAEEDEGAASRTPVLSVENVNELLGQAMAVLPAEPVAPGATWESSATTTLPIGRVQVDSRYTYQGAEQREGKTLERIELAATLQLAPDAEQTAPALKVNQQQLAGVMWFDRETGRLDSSQLEQQLVTESEFRDEPITVRVTSRTELRVVP